MNSVVLDEKDKVVPFFRKLGQLAANVENGVKEVQNKISLPKSDLPENSAFIASVQVLDSLEALKKEISNTEEELASLERSRQDFIDSFQKGVRDTERKIDELENTLKKYGYVSSEPPHLDIEENRGDDKSNSENETTEENATSQATDVTSPANVEQVMKSDKKRLCTPEYSNRSLAYILRNKNKLQNGSSTYNADDVTPQLKLRSSCRRQTMTRLQTPVCFSDDVVCTPGLFIPFQQKCLRNGTAVNPNFYEPSFFTSNRRVQEVENVCTNQQSPQFYEEDVTVELFKKVKLHSSYSRQKREESTTPEEPVLHAQQLLEEIRKSTKKNPAKREESTTPEEPVLHAQQLLEEIRKSTKKNPATRLPIKEGRSTPESPKLKTLHYLRKSKIYQHLLKQPR